MFVYCMKIIGTPILLSLALLIAAPAVADGLEVESREVTVWSMGTRLAGDVWQPKDLGADEKLPGIVVVHGWGGEKRHLNTRYAPQFAALGFVVLTIDYRGWGDSDPILMADDPIPDETDEDGYVTVRMKPLIELVDPKAQTEDTLAALHFIAGEAHVDATRLGLWGTSLGGGVIFAAALKDPRVKSMVSQIGAVNTVANFADMMPQLSAMQSARARGEADQYPGQETKNPLFKGLPDNIHFGEFDTMADADSLNAATLIIDAADEELFDIAKNGHLLHEKLKARGIETRYLTVPGKHYDVYRGEQYETALKEASDWFVKTLK